MYSTVAEVKTTEVNYLTINRGIREPLISHLEQCQWAENTDTHIKFKKSTGNPQTVPHPPKKPTDPPPSLSADIHLGPELKTSGT